MKFYAVDVSDESEFVSVALVVQSCPENYQKISFTIKLMLKSGVAESHPQHMHISQNKMTLSSMRVICSFVAYNQITYNLNNILYF